jgi:Domain of unknown function (DUF4260)
VVREPGPDLNRSRETVTSVHWKLTSPVLLLRAEGAAALIAAIALYNARDGNWPLFLVLLLVPDLSALGYLWNPVRGAAWYNAAHTYLGVGVLALGGLATGHPGVALCALIWAAHIGMDRLLGYGLKTGEAVQNTHLGGLPTGAVRVTADLTA